MYTIEEFRGSSSTYQIPHAAIRECGRNTIIRSCQIPAETGYPRPIQALQQLLHLLRERLLIAARRPASAVKHACISSTFRRSPRRAGVWEG